MRTAPKDRPTHPPEVSHEALAFDVVCGQLVDTGTRHTVRFLQKTYYFCCAACQATFEKDPQAHAHSDAFGPFH